MRKLTDKTVSATGARPRAGIVVTGTEVLTGAVRDANGPWLSAQLRALGVEVAHITCCGDRRQDLLAQLEFLRSQDVQLIITTGGLGPTADDLTAEVVAEFCDRPVHLDVDLERRIGEILAGLSRRFSNIDRDALAAANRKQAMVPEQAAILGPAGTAPGLVVTHRLSHTPVIVLPGPPGELQALWSAAIDAAPVKAVVAGIHPQQEAMMRLFGIPESEITDTLREFEAEHGPHGLEITTCLRAGELEVSALFDRDKMSSYEALVKLFGERHPKALYSRDGASVDRMVADRLVAHRWKLAVAESCTGGLVGSRLTEVPGASEWFAGGVVTYSDSSKSALLHVDSDLIDQFGAVSVEVADAMAIGVMERFGVDLSLAVTGVAGPGGGTDEKPVGTVCFAGRVRDGRDLVRKVQLFGSRSDIRERSTTVALHIARRLLSD